VARLRPLPRRLPACHLAPRHRRTVLHHPPPSIWADGAARRHRRIKPALGRRRVHGGPRRCSNPRVRGGHPQRRDRCAPRRSTGAPYFSTTWRA